MTASFVRRYIKKLDVDAIFTTRDLLHLGSRSNIDQTLQRMVKREEIRRLSSGVFINSRATREPTPREVAEVKARAFGKEISETAKAQADRLQPATLEHNGSELFTDTTYFIRGSTTRFKYGAKVITLKGTSAKRLHLDGEKIETLVKALWLLGKHEGPEAAERLNLFLGRKEKQMLRQAKAWMPAWLAKSIASGSSLTSYKEQEASVDPSPPPK